MDALTVLNLLVGFFNVTVLAFQLRKEWQTRHPVAHPLEATLRTVAEATQNIALAVRELDRVRAPRTRRPPAP